MLNTFGFPCRRFVKGMPLASENQLVAPSAKLTLETSSAL